MRVIIDQNLAEMPVAAAESPAFTLPPRPELPGIRVERALNEAGNLSVRISTSRIVISSVSHADSKDLYECIYGQAEVMKKFQNGDPWTPERFSKRLEIWVQRWQTADPFSAFTIRDREGAFIGVAVMGHGSLPGRSELAFAVRQEAWGRGFGKEAMDALVGKFAAILRSERSFVEGIPFEIIEATVREDNIPSINILSSLGMQQRPDDLGLATTAAQYERARRLYVGAVYAPQEPLCDTSIDCGKLQISNSFL